MKKFFDCYMNDSIKLELWQKIGIGALVVSIAGFIGWVYEFIFYYFNFGMDKFYWQGGNFLPWINIYAFGALLIIACTYKYKKSPIKVVLISSIVTGILEYLGGYFVYTFMDGLRLWDYNTEILNFGNINGFICLRSVLCFGISSLALMYLILPFFIYLSNHMNKKTFLIISITIVSIIMIDELYNLVFARILSLPRARDIYKPLGINYMTYKRG